MKVTNELSIPCGHSCSSLVIIVKNLHRNGIIETSRLMNIIKIVTAIVLALLVFIVQPVVRDFYRLPAAEVVVTGTKLTDIFSGFGKQIDSYIESDSSLPQSLLCVSCSPASADSQDCLQKQASLIAKSLNEAQQRMWSWHLSSAALTTALELKYEPLILRRIYFAVLANLLRSNSLESICKENFGKTCHSLEKSEILSLHQWTLTGKISNSRPVDEKRYLGCF